MRQNFFQGTWGRNLEGENLEFSTPIIKKIIYIVLFFFRSDVKDFQLKKFKTKLATIRTVELLRDVKMWPPEL